MLNPTVRKYVKTSGVVYVGRVKVIENDKMIYSHSTGIQRVNKEDALLDAIWLAEDLK